MKYALTILFCILLCGCTVTNTPYNSTNKTEIIKVKNYLGYFQDEDGNMVLPLNTDCYLTTVRDDLKQEMIDTASKMLFEYHRLLDSHKYYRDENGNRIINLKTINSNFNEEIIIDEKLYNAIREAIEISILTKGYFNPTIGKVADVYEGRFLSYETENTDPDSKKLETAMATVVPYELLEEHIILNPQKSSVTLIPYNGYEFEIDLGAFSKGHVSEMIYNKLISYNSSFILNCGSSSLITYSNPDENVNWSIGAKVPDKPDETLFAFKLNNGALSTSGDYEQYYLLEDGTRRHHILNPFTGVSENYYREILLSCNEKAGLMDAFTTALYSIEDIDEAISMIENIEDYYDISINYCFVSEGYRLTVNKAFYDEFIIQYNSSDINKIEVIE